MYSTCDHNRCANEDRYRTVCTFYVKQEKIEAKLNHDFNALHF